MMGYIEISMCEGSLSGILSTIKSEFPIPLIGTKPFTVFHVCTSLEVQKEPAVAEVEVGVVSVLVHELKQLRIQDLYKKAAQDKK